MNLTNSNYIEEIVSIIQSETNPKKLSKIHFKNKLKKYIHLTLFYLGFFIGYLNILAYTLF